MEKNMDLQNFDEDGLRARGKSSISDQKRAPEFDQDRYDLARVGKEQVLKVCFPRSWFRCGTHTNSVALGW